MSALYVRDIPRQIVDAIKRRARLHHRSLQGELHALLHQAAELAPPIGGREHLTLKLSPSRSTKPWTRDEIYDDFGR